MKKFTLPIRICHKCPKKCDDGKGTFWCSAPHGRPRMSCRDHVQEHFCPMGKFPAELPKDYDPTDWHLDSGGSEGCDCA